MWRKRYYAQLARVKRPPEGVSLQGVTIRFPCPLSLQAQIPWSMLPATLAGMKILAAGATSHAGTVISMLHLTDLQVGELERACGRMDPLLLDSGDVIEHESEFLDEIDRLLTWGSGLAAHCPLSSVSRDLGRLPHLDDAELEQVVLRMIS
jgi:hypothetical protein